MSSEVLKSICYTEKFTEKGALLNQYVFDVAIGSAKIEIRKSVEVHFGVSVVAVNTIRRDGKMRRNKAKRGAYGLTPRRKLAIVTLKTGDKIEIV